MINVTLYYFIKTFRHSLLPFLLFFYTYILKPIAVQNELNKKLSYPDIWLS
ncbi:hypothetical protein HMPREF9392_1687 [Streptococcus sanguinis SK678]|nr:hypothetical protein HMPREF9392_1687 [Streptococcus sanguinis SK678]